MKAIIYYYIQLNISIETLVIATHFCCYLYHFLQRKRILYTTKPIRCDIDGLLQPLAKELQYSISIATGNNIALNANQIVATISTYCNRSIIGCDNP
jgi:hypothetical protein